MIIRPRTFSGPDRIRLIAIETMKGAFGSEGALRFFSRRLSAFASTMHPGCVVLNCDNYNRKGRGFSEFLLDVANSIMKDGSAVGKKLCIRSLGTTMMPTSISVFWAPLLRFAIKTWASEQMALPILRKDSVSRSAAFPTLLPLASVRHPCVELIKLLCFEREAID